MPHYLIESSHTPEECVRALTAIMESGSQILSHSWFACGGSAHTGWINIEADNETQARYVLPPLMRSAAHVVEVRRFTPEEINGFHKKR